MKKLIIFLCLIFLLVYPSLSSIVSDESFFQNMNIKPIYATYGFDVTDINQRIEHSDYIFIGKVKKFKGLLPYNGDGLRIPYSYFNVEVIDTLKGDIKHFEVDIIFFGGIEDNSLYVLDPEHKKKEEMLPIEGKYYLFSAKKTTKERVDTRLTEDSFSIVYPYSMIYLEDYICKSTYSFNMIKEYLIFLNNNERTDDIVIIDDPGGGGTSINDGSSFDKAINLVEGISLGGYIPFGTDPVYYTFTTSEIGNIKLYSFYYIMETNIAGFLYDSEKSLILDDYNSGDEDNFYIYTTQPPGEYYIKVIPEEQDIAGDFIITYQHNQNCSCVNSYENLTISENSVNVNNQIIWTGSTVDYDSEWLYAVNRWNAEGYVDIIKDNLYTNHTLVIDTFYDYFSIFGVYHPDELFDTIEFNEYYFSQMTSGERYMVMMHEIGHALGLNEFNKSSNSQINVSEDEINVMVQGRRSLLEIGQCDRLVYSYLWGD